MHRIIEERQEKELDREIRALWPTCGSWWGSSPPSPRSSASCESECRSLEEPPDSDDLWQELPRRMATEGEESEVQAWLHEDERQREEDWERVEAHEMDRNGEGKEKKAGQRGKRDLSEVESYGGSSPASKRRGASWASPCGVLQVDDNSSEELEVRRLVARTPLPLHGP